MIAPGEQYNLLQAALKQGEGIKVVCLDGGEDGAEFQVIGDALKVLRGIPEKLRKRHKVVPASWRLVSWENLNTHRWIGDPYGSVWAEPASAPVGVVSS